MTPIVRYEGERLYAGPRVWRVDADGIRTPLPYKVRYHVVGEDTPWEWGYGGSGPAELALNLLVDVLGGRARCLDCDGRGRRRDRRCYDCGGTGVEQEVFRLHQPLKWAWVAGLAETRWALEAAELRAWVLAHLPVPQAVSV